MFILVNHSDEYGLNCNGKFNTHKEAFECMAGEVADDYDGFDLMSLYPFSDKDDCLRYENSDVHVWAGKDWCNAYNRHYNDKWLIIEA